MQKLSLFQVPTFYYIREAKSLSTVLIYYTVEKGLLVLEDLKDPNRSDGPMISLNKDKVADVKTVHIILESLAKFHGIWLCWMNAENPIELGGLNRDALFEGKYLLKVS